MMADGSMPLNIVEDNATNDVLEVVIESAAIRRLIDEVRAEEFEVPRSYNRTFNRHNR